MATVMQKVKDIEDEMARTQKNKATAYHLGLKVISTARTCSVILIVLDAIKPITHKCLIEKELEGFSIRLRKTPPNLTFRKKDKGGINFTSTVTNTHLDLETVKAICSKYRIHNADVSLRYDATAYDLIDVIEGSRIYMPYIYVVGNLRQTSPLLPN